MVKGLPGDKASFILEEEVRKNEPQMMPSFENSKGKLLEMLPSKSSFIVKNFPNKISFLGLKGELFLSN